MTLEERLHSAQIYAGRIVTLRLDDVRLPSGRTATREIVEHRGAVAVVPLAADGSVFLVRQFRSAVDQVLLEVPAGTIEPGESVETCLQRELAEEIGMQAARLELLCHFFPSPGFLTEEVHLYLARELAPYRLQGEEEDLAVVRLPLPEARALVARGEVRDAKSIIGILLASERMRPG